MNAEERRNQEDEFKHAVMAKMLKSINKCHVKAMIVIHK